MVTGIAYRLRAPLHLALHLALVGRVAPYAVCHALLPQGASRVKPLPELQGWYEALSTSLLILPFPPTPGGLATLLRHSLPGQCRCVVTVLLLLLGCVVSVAWNFAWEAQEMLAFCRSHQGRGAAAPPCSAPLHRTYQAWDRSAGMGSKALCALLVGRGVGRACRVGAGFVEWNRHRHWWDAWMRWRRRGTKHWVRSPSTTFRTFCPGLTCHCCCATMAGPSVCQAPALD